jgi:hypothetical protein
MGSLQGLLRPFLVIMGANSPFNLSAEVLGNIRELL